MHNLIIVLFFFASNIYAKTDLPRECENYKHVTKAHLALFNKKDFIELGECLAEQNLKRNKLINLKEACAEVEEDKEAFFARLSLSKYEAILIGECLGAIEYIHTRFHLESNQHYPYHTYQCVKGIQAIKKIKSSHLEFFNKSEIKQLLCY